MARKPEQVHVLDYQALAGFCKDRGWRPELYVQDGLWTLKLRDAKGKVVSNDSVRGDPPGVFDQLALDAAITLGRSGKLT